MSQEQEKIDRSPLLPLRHPERDFFICDIFDAAPKSDTASMEHPLFTLSTKPDMTPREYRKGDNWLKVSPSDLGLATVHDRDILIYCISQCMARLNQGLTVHRTLRFNVHDLLKTTNRATNNLGYERFRAALNRLQSTRIETNITTGGQEQWEVFSFIDRAKTIKETRDGRMVALEITLSDWVFNAINEKSGDILTISKEYFRLRKPLERRLYELARKHCGQNSKWQFRVETLHERTGSTSTLKEFRRMLKSIIVANQKHNHIPDYTFELKGDTVVMRPRSDFTDVYSEPEKPNAMDKIILRGSAHETAKKFAKGWCTHHLENEWRHWLGSKGTVPDKPEGSFVGFVKAYSEKHGSAR
jgi:hypothetical protein